MPNTPVLTERRNDLDWLRTYGILAVFVYHCLMFFNIWPWHVKNTQIDDTWTTAFTILMSPWLMPLFFIISGISSFYALQKRSSKTYLFERLKRLGIPLLLGAFILSPPQVYMERITLNQFEGSFLQFFPHYFDGVYLDIGGPGNFAFVGLHLWYLFVLLFFSLLTLPLFQKMKNRSSVVMKPLHLVILLLPLLIIASVIDVLTLGGWDITYYFLLFLYGFFIFPNVSIRQFILRFGKYSLLISLITSIMVLVLFFSGLPDESMIYFVLFKSLRVINGLSFITYLFYLGEKYLTHTNSFLRYGSEATMPFYILHQPIIVTIGFFIATFTWSIYIKLIFLVITSFVAIMIIYQLIKPINLLRVVFGLKGRTKTIKIKANRNLHN